MASNRRKSSSKTAAAQGGATQYIRDSDVKDLVLRIGSKGRRTWTMVARFGGSKSPTRRSIGNADNIPVEVARQKVLEWKAMNRQLIDPAEEAVRVALAEEGLNRATFRQAMKDHVSWLPERARNRRAKGDQQLLEREFLDPDRNPWIDKPLCQVTAIEVQDLIEAIRDRPAPTVAYNAFSLLKQFFKWVLAPKTSQAYGISETPLTNLFHSTMYLTKNKRQRTHDADEIRAYWAATDEMGHPWGEYFKALLLTGQRNRDVREATWAEFDVAKRMWTIPAWRYKSERDHYVPLSVPMMQLLERIKARQTANHGPYVFSTNDGWKPIVGIGKATAKFRKKVAEFYLEATGKQLKHWILHDDRRTVRSVMSNIGVPSEVAEAVIGHEKKDLEKIYNTNPFKSQKRRALHLWAEELKFIIDDPSRSLEAEENEVPEWPTRWNDATKRDATR